MNRRAFITKRIRLTDTTDNELYDVPDTSDGDGEVVGKVVLRAVRLFNTTGTAVEVELYDGTTAAANKQLAFPLQAQDNVNGRLILDEEALNAYHGDDAFERSVRIKLTAALEVEAQLVFELMD